MRKSASPPAIRNRSQNSENQIRFNKVIIYITECRNKKMTKCSPHWHKTAPSLVPAAHLTLWPHFCLAGELNNLSLRCAWSPCGSCPLIPALSLLGLAGFPSGFHSQNTAGWMTAERGRLLCTASISICANMILLLLLKKKKSLLNGDQLEPLCNLCSWGSDTVTSKHTSKDRKERGETAREPGRVLFFSLYGKHTNMHNSITSGLPQEISSSG